ncbi:MAG: hypothetical protein IT233_03990 [Bacteroidia bacterium]|nr:hypothetical protein [Bacteroidia bacterium]
MEQKVRNAYDDSRSRRIARHERHIMRVKALKEGHYRSTEKNAHDGVDTIIGILGVATAGLVMYAVLNVIF